MAAGNGDEATSDSPDDDPMPEDSSSEPELEEVTMKETPEEPVKKVRKKRARTPKKRIVRLAHELPTERRRAIKEAMEDHKAEHKLEWDRSAGVKTHTVMRKRTKPGAMRSFNIPLLDTNLGDSWEIPVTVINGSRPAKITIIAMGQIISNHEVNTRVFIAIYLRNFPIQS